MARPPSVGTVLIDRVLDIACGLEEDERKAAEFERQLLPLLRVAALYVQGRRERHASIRNEARLLAQQLTAFYERPEAA